MSEHRAPVQGSGMWWLPVSDPRRDAATKQPGTIKWYEHEQAWGYYAERYGKSQSSERIADRGGFGYFELVDLLGREPTTWEPNL